MLTRSGGALTNFTGFSESVTLGEIGDLKRDNAVVMHVRFEDAQPREGFRWRGVALDEFTGRGWRKSGEARRSIKREKDRGFFQIGTTEALHRLTTQTVFLEPIGSPALLPPRARLRFRATFPLCSLMGKVPYRLAVTILSG